MQTDSLVALYDIRPGNGAGQFLQPRSPHGAILPTACDEKVDWRTITIYELPVIRHHHNQHHLHRRRRRRRRRRQSPWFSGAVQIICLLATIRVDTWRLTTRFSIFIRPISAVVVAVTEIALRDAAIAIRTLATTRRAITPSCTQ